MRKIYIALLGLIFVGAAFAGSTVNPSIPAQNSPLTSAPLRANFMATYADVNNILGQFAGTTAPASPSRYQYWLDTTTSPAILKIYDGLSWVQTAKLNVTTHAWSPVGTFIGSPVATTYGGTGSDLHAATGAVSMSSGVTSVGTLPAAYLAAPLTSLSTFNANGLMTQTATNTFTGRTLTGTSAEITISNGNGVSGNPTASLPNALTFTGKTITGGTFVGPALGTPVSGVATNLTGTAAGLTAGNVTTNANLTGGVTSIGNAATVVTNANLTGPITSVGNATSIASQTGTGTKIVVDTSPTLAGVPLSTTAAVDTNTTQIATTAFVIGQATGSNPTMAGTVAVGTSTRYARSDHVHPSDTSRALLAGSSSQAFAASALTATSINGVTTDSTTNAPVTAASLAAGTLPASVTTLGTSGAVTISKTNSSQLILNSSNSNGADLVIQEGGVAKALVGHITGVTGLEFSGDGATSHATLGTTGNFSVVGTLSVGSGGLAGHSMCWKTATLLSYCTSVVASDGTCTCH